MIRGTTPTHTFTIPFNADTNIIEKVEITYKQCDKLILTKNINECEIVGNTIRTTLTQEETFKFDHRQKVKIQIRISTYDKMVFASYIFTDDVLECQSNEVL